MSCCPNCGGPMRGDGVTSVRSCESVDTWGIEPDAPPMHCIDAPENPTSHQTPGGGGWPEGWTLDAEGLTVFSHTTSSVRLVLSPAEKRQLIQQLQCSLD